MKRKIEYNQSESEWLASFILGIMNFSKPLFTYGKIFFYIISFDKYFIKAFIVFILLSFLHNGWRKKYFIKILRRNCKIYFF